MNSLPIFANRFAPSTSLTGNEPLSVFRGANCFVRGIDGFLKIRNYAGSKDLGEDYDISGETLTGTLEWTAGDPEITGTGTDFTAELHIGQFILSGTEIFVVRRIAGDTTFYAERAPDTTATGQTARYMLTLFEIDKTRGVMRWGNAVKQDKGDILFVGDGEFFRNGVTTGFTATRTPKRLEFQVGGTYTEFPLGFSAEPPLPTVTVVAGGTKLMSNGFYSFMFSYWNSVSGGFSNPSEVLKTDTTPASIQIVPPVASRFQFDFTTAMVGMPANADGFIIWQSLSGGAVAAVNFSNYSNGPWLLAAKVKVADLSAGDIYLHEALDSELGQVASGDNNAPADCEFLAEYANTVFLISSLGKKKAGRSEGSSPGHYAIPQKVSNREAFPLGWATSVGEDITGFAPGLGRLFCLTEKGLPFVSATGRTEIARLVPTLLDIPFTSRPFWSKGNIQPHSICTVQGDVFVYTGRGLLMSPRGADEYSNPFEIGKAIQDLTAGIPAGHFLVRHDPKNQQILVIASGCERNADGYWVSKIFPLDLENNVWQPIIELTSTTRDMIVSGAEIIEGRLEFLAGGRVSGGTFEINTYRYDESDGNPVEYYFAFQPVDSGEEQRGKRFKSFRVTGRITDFSITIHGANRGEEISIDDIENGTNPIAGPIAFTDTTGIVRGMKKPYEVKNLQIWSLRCAGTWAGTGELDQIEEIVPEIGIHGGRK